MRFLVTAGPTREPIDPVRFLSNRSTGRMGYAVARAALAAGHEVDLISGPVALDPPKGASVVSVLTAADMLEAVRKHLPACDVLVMAAAVADFRPARCASEKIKKAGGALTLELEPTEDVLGSVRGNKGQRIVVGFAAESGDPEAEAARKLRAKGLDLVVGNDISAPDAGFEADTNRVVLVSPSQIRRFPLMPKDAVAAEIVRWIEGASR